ncbi:hypothetical protein DL95DRAFT_401935 [Leptodontidium sp. 2 PMI_412]|nr:hypothetical protein BKA61DRAFT_569694 [Leptodontidium sp. MPI-SDFR-AT-0119]KAH9222929.1 hypothetical protein DL95DRAFT_401935 [Leptodontidium sp. 2 PMI_412]
MSTQTTVAATVTMAASVFANPPVTPSAIYQHWSSTQSGLPRQRRQTPQGLYGLVERTCEKKQNCEWSELQFGAYFCLKQASTYRFSMCVFPVPGTASWFHLAWGARRQRLRKERYGGGELPESLNLFCIHTL